MPVFGTNMNSNLPIEQIKNMRAQGLDNNQIIQALQKDGFNSSNIFDALNQADMSSGAPLHNNVQTNKQQFPEEPLETNFSPSTNSSSDRSGMMTPPNSGNYNADVSTEELVEAIIDEKWNDLLKDVNKIVEWKNSMNNKFNLMEQKISDIKSEFDKLHSAILGKINDYDANITNVGAEVKAMEKVFSKVLPVFTENVSELSKITKNFKKTGITKK